MGKKVTEWWPQIACGVDDTADSRGRESSFDDARKMHANPYTATAIASPATVELDLRTAVRDKVSSAMNGASVRELGTPGVIGYENAIMKWSNEDGCYKLHGPSADVLITGLPNASDERAALDQAGLNGWRPWSRDADGTVWLTRELLAAP